MSDSCRCDSNNLSKLNSLKVVITPLSTISTSTISNNININTPISLTPALTPPVDIKAVILRQNALQGEFIDIEDSYDTWSLQAP